MRRYIVTRVLSSEVQQRKDTRVCWAAAQSGARPAAHCLQPCPPRPRRPPPTPASPAPPLPLAAGLVAGSRGGPAGLLEPPPPGSVTGGAAAGAMRARGEARAEAGCSRPVVGPRPCRGGGAGMVRGAAPLQRSEVRLGRCRAAGMGPGDEPVDIEALARELGREAERRRAMGRGGGSINADDALQPVVDDVRGLSEEIEARAAAGEGASTSGDTGRPADIVRTWPSFS